MIDLKAAIEQNPDCLESSEEFRTYLKGLYPDRADQVRIRILADAMDYGILDEIECGKDSPYDIVRYSVLMERDFGYSRQLVSECIIQLIKALESEMGDDDEEVEGDFEIEGQELIKYYGDQSQVVIPDYINRIGKNAFSNRYDLTNITIPDSVTSIGEEAFSDCTCLTSIILPNNITEIENGLFRFCSSLTNITIRG